MAKKHHKLGAYTDREIRSMMHGAIRTLQTTTPYPANDMGDLYAEYQKREAFWERTPIEEERMVPEAPTNIHHCGRALDDHLLAGVAVPKCPA